MNSIEIINIIQNKVNSLAPSNSDYLFTLEELAQLELIGKMNIYLNDFKKLFEVNK